MAKDDVTLSSMPDRMVNTGQCKSRLHVSVSTKGKPSSKTWIYVVSSAGELYGLEDTKTEDSKTEDLAAIKVRTDDHGKASLGMNLPSMVGKVRLAAASKFGDAKDALAGKAGDAATCQITLEADKPARMVLESELEEVVADGVSTTRVWAQVTDQHGNPIKGQEVSFQAERGVIDPDSVNSITDDTGRAYASISSQQVGLTKVTAVNRYKSWLEDIIGGAETDAFPGGGGRKSPLGGEETLKSEIQVRFVPSHASNLILNVDRSAVPADGKEQARITAQLKDEFGNPVQGRKMIFETDLGELHPSREVNTDPDGKAVVLLSSTRMGSASVRVRTEDEESLLSATQVVFEAASPSLMEMKVEPDEARADGETECVVSVEVKDEMGNPVPGKNVNFKTDLGTLLSDENRTTDAEGHANVRIVSRRAGTATVQVVCGEARGEEQIKFLAGVPSSVAISLNPTVEESWRGRIPSGHWDRMQQALRNLEERRFAEAIKIMEAEESQARKICDYSALCNLAFAYQQLGRKDRAEEIYRSILQRNGARKEIAVKADGMEEVFGVVLPDTNGRGTEPRDYLLLDPKDYLVNIVVTDSQGNQVPDLEVEFGSNFGWVPDEFKAARTNRLGAATSLVTTFAPSGSSEVEFAWVNLGLMKENALDYSGAQKCYRSAIEAVPESTRGLESLASVLVKTGEVGDAKRCYYNLARAYSRRGNSSKALEYYGKAIELDPKYAKALAGYGTVCLKVGELERARRYLEEAVKIDKSMKAAMANLGLAYYLKGNFEQAIRMNKRALKLDPEFKPALVNLYQIHMAMGEREKAAGYASQVKALGA
jgi:tetratricopeptide (TPR) repeat protein